MKRALALAAVVGIVAVVLPMSSAVSASKVTFTVGTAREMDSPNYYVGVNVSSFETWNMEYDEITNLSPKDLSPTPGIAESWKSSDDGLTWTYTIRKNAKWSDGQPVTPDDVAYTITRYRDEEWSNASSFVSLIDDVKVDGDTVVVHTSAPDPKLPALPIYVLPKHVWEPMSLDQVTSFENTDPVTSGPFRLVEWKKGQFWRMAANKDYWGPKPKVDEVVFKIYANGQALATALEQGEVDIVEQVPTELVEKVKSNKNITVERTVDGSFIEVGINYDPLIGDPHPALKDLKVRQAIAHAIDKQTLVDKVQNGWAAVADGMNTSVDPSWRAEIPAADRLDFDLAKANQILDDAGYKKGSDGIRTMPDGTTKLNLRYLSRTESLVAAPIAQYVTEWLKEIGIATTVTSYSDAELTPLLAAGKWDLFYWGWTPYADPDAQLSYFTCDQRTAEEATPLYNDANYCNPTYDDLYTQQKTELDPAKRKDLVHQMLLQFYKDVPYVVISYDVTPQAYRNDRFTGFVRQPEPEGPLIFSQTDPSYSLVAKIGGGGGGSNTGLIVGVAAGALVVLVLGGIVLARRRPAEDRE